MTTDHIWNEFSTVVFRYFLSRVADRQLAEDLRQDVFVKIHGNIGQVKNREKLGHWISVIMRNTLADHWKKNARAILPGTGDDNDDVSSGALATGERHLVERCIQNMIGQIPPKYALPLAMSDLEGIRQKDVAGRLQLSESGVKSRIQRGRVMLRDAIQECCRVELNTRNEIVDYHCTMESCREENL